VLRHDLEQAVFSLPMAQALSAQAVLTGRVAKVHIKIDTGMGRIGLHELEEAASFARELTRLPGVQVAGTFTHVARADEEDPRPTLEQLKRFQQFLKAIADAGVDPGLRHMANSAAALSMPETRLDAVRVGLALYGLYPGEWLKEKIRLRPAMRWKAQVSHSKLVRPGTPVSYGGTYVTAGHEWILTVPVGYADGYSRRLSGKGHVLIGGRRCAVAGRVCMDQLMVASLSPANPGDEVVLLGRQGRCEITAEEMALWSDTINYEVVCGISKRVPRIYSEDGLSEEATWLTGLGPGRSDF